MSLEWEQVVIAARDPVTLGRWWADLLGWVVVDESAETSEIQPSAGQRPGLFFLAVGLFGAAALPSGTEKDYPFGTRIIDIDLTLSPAAVASR